MAGMTYYITGESYSEITRQLCEDLMDIRLLPTDTTIIPVPLPLRKALYKGLRHTRTSLTTPDAQIDAELLVEEMWDLVRNMLDRDTRGMSQTTITHLAHMIQERPHLQNADPSRAAVLLIERWMQLIQDPNFALSEVMRLLVAHKLQCEPAATPDLLGIRYGPEESIQDLCLPESFGPMDPLEDPCLRHHYGNIQMVVDIPRRFIDGSSWR
ncbi:uncharacterized protein N7459_005610 [Penicillium hispanicum]|uniref:uncharacterized protein n=1 Tax=Penicillium hispanicum TaxID=1080232 RepID=UPI002541C295|nr:uncharacterized protein N7459_005610 [Penicillium hispanicum]KAJ5579625.1 hypothetical protein N7459_005610 [Penicillium hispanicum]